MFTSRMVLDNVPEHIYRLCDAKTDDERDTIAACVRAYARDCIEATFRAIDTEPMVRDAWRYRVMVENGVVPSEWHEIISEPRDGFRQRADAAFDAFVRDELGGWDE